MQKLLFTVKYQMNTTNILLVNGLRIKKCENKENKIKPSSCIPLAGANLKLLRLWKRTFGGVE